MRLLMSFILSESYGTYAAEILHSPADIKAYDFTARERR